MRMDGVGLWDADGWCRIVGCGWMLQDCGMRMDAVGLWDVGDGVGLWNVDGWCSIVGCGWMVSYDQNNQVFID